MEIFDGGITSPKGFFAANCAAGIKYTGRDDMAMIFSKEPAEVSGTYTRNVVKAAPVIWDRNITASGKKSQVVIINAGIANACTGEEGIEVCKKTSKAVKKAFGEEKNIEIDEESVLVASTGVIGMQIPIDKIEKGVGILVKGLSDLKEAGDK